MDARVVVLTETDRKILESYKRFIEGLSHYMGRSYEIVLHCLEDFDNSVIKIINGFHTGRTENAPITDLALSMLSQIQENSDNKDDIVYFSKNRKGESLKSTTITVHGENDRIIGLICINFYMNTPLSEIINEFVVQDDDNVAIKSQQESYMTNSDELIASVVQQIREEIYHNDDIPASNKNKEIVKRLSQNGIFNFKDSVIKVADLMNLSKNTIYMHLRNVSE